MIMSSFRARHRLPSRGTTRLGVAALIGAALLGARATAGAARALPCAMGLADARWVAAALAHWPVAVRDLLRLPPAPLPTIVTFDRRCAFIATPRAGGARVWRGTPHGGTVTLPDGKRIPAGVTSLAAPAGDASGRAGYFVMSLPSMWRAGGVRSGLGLERLMDGVLLHELMHTRQFYFANPVLADVTRRYGLSEDSVDDDAVQRAYEKNPAYVADYTAERDLLFAAAAAPDTAEARRLAREALARLRARRARWFVGNAARWGPVDEIFLTMESLGQWVAYTWYTTTEEPHLTPDAALREVRRGGRYWTQDEGLALFLVVDRLVPGWQRLAFAPEPATAEALLARAGDEPAAVDDRSSTARRPGASSPSRPAP
ncbi:hypothetical protein tb265_12790 [Gemmatimonadetes bacterium T265]|nr:hypothetical protein tb265_12790 [Gemmatimonadetes bacterium T265]